MNNLIFTVFGTIGLISFYIFLIIITIGCLFFLQDFAAKQWKKFLTLGKSDVWLVVACLLLVPFIGTVLFFIFSSF